MIKEKYKYHLVLLLALLIFGACSDEKDDLQIYTSIVDPILDLTTVETTETNQITLKWKNPDYEYLKKVEISYAPKSTTGLSFEPISMVVEPNTESTITLKVPRYATYIVSITALRNLGKRSEPVTIEARPYLPEGTTAPTPVFLNRADTLMTAMVNLLLKNDGVWYGGYPVDHNGLNGGIAVIWGGGGAFSGYTAMRKAALPYSQFSEKYTALDDRVFNGINKYITSEKSPTTERNISAYAVYPGNGNQRLWDDNAWVGLDMADLYLQTNDNKYLEKAKMVWDYAMTGYDDVFGGGIYWTEIPFGKSKHSCSTGPVIVLGLKMYQITGESIYLETSIDLYNWMLKVLQDPIDYLFYDLINAEGNVDQAKYSYNTGQPMQAAALLYKITKDEKYLKDAQRMANSAFNKWFTAYESPYMNKKISYIDGHTWFNAILLRGFIELYEIDNNRKYITAYEETFSNLWLSKYGLNRVYNLLCYNYILGDRPQDSWDILHVGACVEMFAHFAQLEHQGK